MDSQLLTIDFIHLANPVLKTTISSIYSNKVGWAAGYTSLGYIRVIAYYQSNQSKTCIREMIVNRLNHLISVIGGNNITWHEYKTIREETTYKYIYKCVKISRYVQKGK